MQRLVATLSRSTIQTALSFAPPAVAQCSSSALPQASHVGAAFACIQRYFGSSPRRCAADDMEQPTLRWPLPVDVLAAHPELAKIVMADAAQSQATEEDDTASYETGKMLHYRESVSGSEAKFGRITKRRPVKRRRSAAQAPQPGLQALTTMTVNEIAEVLAECHTRDVAILDVRQTCDFAESMVIATGNSNGHVRAVAQAVHSKMKERLPQGLSAELLDNHPVALPIEGDPGSNWALLDAGTIVVHVLTEDARQEYDLEGLWAEHSDIRRIDSQRQVQTLSTMRI